MTFDLDTVNIYDPVASSIALHGDRVALRDGGALTTYRELGVLVERFAAGLRAAGVAPGERVGAAMSKSAQGIALFLAAVRIGAIYIPINPGFKEREIANVVDDAVPALVASDLPGFRRLFPDARTADALLAGNRGGVRTERGGRKPAAMLFTSGTTGRPKGALMTHSSLVNTFTEFNRIWEISEDDRFLHVLPTFHAHGLMMATLCPLFAGATIELMGRFDIDAVLNRLPGTTAMMAVPTIWGRLAEHPGFTRDVARTLRLATSGSAPLSPALYDRLEREVGVVLLDRYGSTEAGMIAANPVGRSRRASVGRVLGGVDVRIVDDLGNAVANGEPGRILVKGENVFGGYWKRPELDAMTWTEDGYFDTGDFAIRDDDGYLTIVGRDKDMIISGGFNVYPREVEIALEELDGVAEAAVFGIPHPDFGEGVAAAVVVEQGVELDPASLAVQLEGRLTAYKRPKVIRFVEGLPRNPMGKLLRKELSEKFDGVFANAS